MIDQALGLLLALATLFTNWLTGSKRRVGWLASFVVECAWTVYAIRIHQWGMLATCPLYLAIFARNWWKWRPEAG